MKKLLSIFLFCLSSLAVDQVTWTLTITNTPVYGDKLTINANIRSWTNSVSGAPQTSILIGANIGASATNLWNQIGGYGYSGPIQRYDFQSTNIIILRGQCGQAFVVTMTGTWGTLTAQTNVCTSQASVGVPITAEPTASRATNIASQLVSNLAALSTNAIPASATMMQNFMQLFNDQVATGRKEFAEDVVISGGTGMFRLESDSPDIWATDIDGGANRSNSIVKIDQDGFGIYFYRSNYAAYSNVFQITRSAAGAAGYGADNATLRTKLIADSVTTHLTNSTGTGNTFTNTTFPGTNTFTGGIAYTRSDITSLATGSNAGIDLRGHYYWTITTGPGGAFDLNGIVAEPDGTAHLIHNMVAQNMTVKHQSGTDPTAANRIITMTGLDAPTVNEGCALIIYNSSVSRWILYNLAP